MAQIKLGPNGLPINEGFFGNQGLGGALASLPGTPVLGGGAPGSRENPIGGWQGYLPSESSGPSTTDPGTGVGTGSYNPTNDPNVPGGGINGNRDQFFPYPGYEQPGAQGALAGGTPPGGYTSGYNPSGGTNVSNTPAPGSNQGIGTTTGGGGPPKLPGDGTQVNPGLPPPASTAGTGGFFGGASPFQQGVTGTQNNQTVPFASERYVTPDAAQRLGSLLGANVVSQNTEGMASPGSGAPSQPMLGLDFGGQGDVQDASMGAYQLQRGDRPEDVAARYKAGLTTKAWAGDQPVPQLAENWDAPYWNRSNPVSTNTPNAQQAGFFGQGGGSPDQQEAFFTWLRGQLGQG